ncbi:hypothetical protein [Lebetimonas sp. JS032]|uniref:hypothetical protein n=1 Tax=Lebetimonas sp. JS032 TaxID=990070 RepID=UPI000467C515|nr:hypothetical protein [Lebetimonas sp. JS032]
MPTSKEKEYFIALWDNLTKNQKIALKIILLSGGENIYSDEYVPEMIKAPSLQTAIKNLIKKDITEKNIYYFQDPFFEFWLKKNIFL